MEKLSLFPLSVILFPYGKLQLRIFEPRYIDLIKESLKTQSEFGVIWLRSGRETYVPNKPIKLAEIGTSAKIVDWSQSESNLLNIIIQGQQRFILKDYQQQESHLYVGNIEWLPPYEYISLPAELSELNELLEQLVQHPFVESLQLSASTDNADELGCLLSQLLPLEEKIKYSLLLMDPLTRLEQLKELLDNYAN